MQVYLHTVDSVGLVNGLLPNYADRLIGRDYHLTKNKKYKKMKKNKKNIIKKKSIIIGMFSGFDSHIDSVQLL